MKRLRVALSVAAVALVSFGLHRSCVYEAPREPAARASTPWREPVTARRSYDLEYDCTESLRFNLADGAPDASAPPDTPITGVAHLRARVVLSPARPPDAEHTLTALRIEALTRHAWSLSGRELLPDGDTARATFERAEILVENDRDGAVSAIHFREDTPPLAKQMLRQIALEIAAIRRRDDAWDVREAAPSGTALARYTRASGDHVTRTREAYETLTAPPHDPRQRHVDDRWTLDYVDGALSSLVGEERITVGDAGREVFAREMHIRLRLVGTDARVAALTDLTGFVRRRPDAPPTAEDVDARLLEQRVAGLTVDELVATLRRFGGAPAVPDHHRFFWRATGLLRQHPEAARALAPVYLDARARGYGRMLVLDLLSQAQTPEAQRAMVELLRDPATRSDPDQGQYLQRLSFIERPEADTVALTRERFEDPATRRPAGFALGSMARRLTDRGDDDEARACNDRIVRALQESRPEERGALVQGLGNARREENTPRFEAYARDAREDVRQSAAAALAQLRSPEAVRALLRLAGDPDGRVRAEALRGLERAALPDEAWPTLVAMVRSGALPAESFPPLYQVLREQSSAHRDGALAVARAMVERGIDDGDTRVRVLALVEELEAR